MNNKKHLPIHPQVRQRARELRQPLTPAEERLWQTLRSRQIEGYKFRRQHPLGRFIVDFYCARVKLVIEVDGDIHKKQVEYDLERTKWLESNGYSVIRFENKAVFEDLATVIDKIVWICHKLEGAGQAKNLEIEAR
jgi:very-short-patch-repair endonuclease